jgi:hypothetical protein
LACAVIAVSPLGEGATPAGSVAHPPVERPAAIAAVNRNFLIQLLLLRLLENDREEERFRFSAEHRGAAKAGAHPANRLLDAHKKGADPFGPAPLLVAKLSPPKQ